MKMKIMSFSWKTGGPPADAGFVLDCRVMRNPHHVPQLRELNGRDRAVQDYVMTDPRYKAMFEEALREALYGNHVAFGCFGGKHRSAAMAEMIGAELRKGGHDVEIIHSALRVPA